MSQFTQRFCLDLANTLARYVKLSPDFFQSMISIHFNTETHTQNLGFSWSQRVKHVLRDGA